MSGRRVARSDKSVYDVEQMPGQLSIDDFLGEETENDEHDHPRPA